MLKLPLYLIVSLQFISLISHAMEKEEKPNNFYSIYLPGMNGSGGQSFRVNGLINVDEKNHKQYKTLSQDNYIDLGQKNCIEYFKKQLDEDPNAKDKKVLLSATSQGTAILVNYVASLDATEQKKLDV